MRKRGSNICNWDKSILCSVLSCSNSSQNNPSFKRSLKSNLLERLWEKHIFVPNLTYQGRFCVWVSSGQGLVYQKSSSRLPCDLDVTKIDLKIHRVHLHPNMNVCTKFGDHSSVLCQVIIRTRFGLLKVNYSNNIFTLSLIINNFLIRYYIPTFCISVFRRKISNDYLMPTQH